MRQPAEVRLVEVLLADGLNDCEIARRTGIPRGTVRDWRYGRRPDFSRHRVYEVGADPQLDPAVELAYAYVLGLYLGDGDIVRMRRTYRLRIALDGIYPGIVAECRGALEIVLPNRASVS